MKSKRHEKILELILETVVETQEDLMRLLREAGYPITQATVSRDIKELRLTKTLSPDGRYRYTFAAAERAPASDITTRFRTIFGQVVDSVDYAGHMVVVKCHTGMANAACEALDQMNFESIVGTLAGDNTFFILARTEEIARKLSQELQTYLAR